MKPLYRLSLAILLLFQSFSTQAHVDLIQELCVRIQNYDRLNPEYKKSTYERVAYWEEVFRKKNIPSNFRLPLEMVHIRVKKNEVALVPNFKYICYLPTVDLLYQTSLSYYEVLQKNLKEGSEVKNVPTMSIALSILCQETWLRDDLIGDQGRSFGMCQLHGFTADYILSKNFRHRDKFNEYIGLDDKKEKYKNHYFKGEDLEKKQLNMLNFLYTFLMYAKGYKGEAAFDAIRKYNGGGEAAQKYAQKVMKRIIEYETLILLYTFGRGNYEEYLNEALKGMTFISPNQGFTDEDAEIFKNTMIQKFKKHAKQLFEMQQINGLEQGFQFQKEHQVSVTVPDSEDSFYILKERSLFSYFREGLWNVLNLEANASYHLFYWNVISGKKVKHIIQSKAELSEAVRSGKDVYDNVKMGEKVYLAKGIKVYSIQGKHPTYTPLYQSIDTNKFQSK